MRITFVIIVLLLLACLFLTACAPGVERFKEKPAGFFWGIWHGWIAPISLIWHLFDPSIRIYETNNTGGWYDFGFYIAVVGGFGSIALTRKRKKCKE
jgi:hypothetical protein